MLRVSEEHLGKQARCPNCQTLNIVHVQTGDPVQFKDPVQSVSPSVPPAANVAPYQTPQYAGVGLRQTAHRGGLILTMGIMSIVCNIALVPGILAWVCGRSDLKKMKDGTMDRSGEGITQAGMIMGIIMTVMAGLSALLVILYFIVVILVVGFSAAAAQ